MTMKKMKKLLSMLLTVIMVLAMAAPSFAAETAVDGPFSITISNAVTDHSYEIYQIFTGDLSKNEKNELTLSNIEWGNGVNNEDLLKALREKEIFANCTSAADVAKVLEGFSYDDKNIRDFAKTVEDYLQTAASTINNSTTSVSVEKAGYYMVKDVAGTSSTTTVSSLVLKVVNTVEVTLKIAANPIPSKTIDDSKEDYAIGDSIPFTLKATLPSDNFVDYDKYELEFVDTLTNLTYIYTAGQDVSTGIKELKVGETTIQQSEFVSKGITVSYTNNELRVKINDVKAIGAVAGSVITVKYNAKLNSSAVIVGAGNDKNTNKLELNFSNNPNGDGTGTTMPTEVEIKTYKITVTKVDGSTYENENVDAATKLAGAEFKLYRIVTSGTGDDAKAVKEYAKIDSTTKEVTWTTEEEATSYTTDGTGVISFEGLATGTNYYVKEVKAPVGYNLATDVNVSINAENNGSAVVEDFAGATLPSTGGIGTTIFYAVGIILMAGAVFFVVRRKRA